VCSSDLHRVDMNGQAGFKAGSLWFSIFHVTSIRQYAV
jgi:hypothetical protein